MVEALKMLGYNQYLISDSEALANSRLDFFCCGRPSFPAHTKLEFLYPVLPCLMYELLTVVFLPLFKAHYGHFTLLHFEHYNKAKSIHNIFLLNALKTFLITQEKVFCTSWGICNVQTYLKAFCYSVLYICDALEYWTPRAIIITATKTRRVMSWPWLGMQRSSFCSWHWGRIRWKTFTGDVSVNACLFTAKGTWYITHLRACLLMGTVCASTAHCWMMNILSEHWLPHQKCLSCHVTFWHLKQSA